VSVEGRNKSARGQAFWTNKPGIEAERKGAKYLGGTRKGLFPHSYRVARTICLTRKSRGARQPRRIQCYPCTMNPFKKGGRCGDRRRSGPILRNEFQTREKKGKNRANGRKKKKLRESKAENRGKERRYRKSKTSRSPPTSRIVGRENKRDSLEGGGSIRSHGWEKKYGERPHW